MSSMHGDYEQDEHEDVMLDPDEADEEVADEEDAPMDSDPDEDELQEQEIQLQNDSFAHFDQHKDSIFAIAQHPTMPQLIATGGGDDTGFLFDLRKAPSASAASQERKGIPASMKLDGHSDSVNAITFTLPSGEFLLTAGLDGQIRSYAQQPATPSSPYSFVASSQEVEEINFLTACPHSGQPNVVALGASDGSVWVYRVADKNAAQPLEIVQAYYMHTGSCTAGCWTPDGKLLATVSEDGSFYVWDVFGEAAAAGLSAQAGSQSLIGLNSLDERFKVENGLYSIAISPGGGLAAVGGAEGNIRVVGLPRLSSASSQALASSSSSAKGGAGAASKAGGGRAAAIKGSTGATDVGSAQAGQILASIQTQSDSIETLAFAPAPLTLMAAGSVDGSIAVFDASRAFAARRIIKNAHDDEAVIKCEFLPASPAPGGSDRDLAWLLTSAGNDGVLRRWDLRSGGGGGGGCTAPNTAAAAPAQSSSSKHGLLGEWRGHRGGGEGGGILGFVQSPGGQTVVTAGDDAVALAFTVTTN